MKLPWVNRLGKSVLISFVVVCIAAVTVGGVFLFRTDWKTRGKSVPVCKDCNLLFVAMDSCGTDMPCYGYGRDTTPNLCSYAKDNILFRDVSGNGTWTLPDYVTVMTGMIPEHHGAQTMTGDQVSPTTPFLPEILQEHGYETYFYVDNVTDTAFPRDFVYYRGITGFDSEGYDEPGYLEKAVAKIKENAAKGKKTFVFLHTYACHSPYTTEDRKKIYTTKDIPWIPTKASEIYFPFGMDFFEYLRTSLKLKIDSRNAGKYTELSKLLDVPVSGGSDAEKLYSSALMKAGLGLDDLNGIYEQYYFFRKADPKDPVQREYVRALYDQKIHEFDASGIATIVKDAAAGEIPENTVVVLYSDHGDELGTHGSWGHGMLYDSVTKNVFVMHVPGAAPRVIRQPVQAVDFLQTMLDILGIRKVSVSDGISLMPAILGQTLPDRMIITDGVKDPNSLVQDKSIRIGNWKLLVADDGKKIYPVSLYDRSGKDPNETHDVLWDNLDVAKRMIGEYRKTITR